MDSYFYDKPYFQIIIDSLKFFKTYKSLKLFAYVILDNHFHLVVSGSELSNIIQSLKRFTARQVIELLKFEKKRWLLNKLAFHKKNYKTESDFQVWQEGSHPQLLQNEEMFIQKIEYIHYNPVKRSLVEFPEHWIYSSARNYILEDHSIIEIDTLDS